MYRKPIRRTCQLLYGNTLSMTFVREDGKAEADAYDLREIGSDVGRGFRLTKIVTHGTGLDARVVRGNTYDCHVSGDGRQSCQCKGFHFRGVCRHTEALRALIARGKIAGGIPGGESEVHEDAAQCCGA